MNIFTPFVLFYCLLLLPSRELLLCFSLSGEPMWRGVEVLAQEAKTPQTRTVSCGSEHRQQVLLGK